MKLQFSIRVVSVIQIISGIALFWFSIDDLQTRIEYRDFPAYRDGQQVSTELLFRTYHLNILLSSMNVIGGLGILLNRFWGWFLSAIAWNTFGIIILLSIIKLFAANTNYTIMEIVIRISLLSIYFMVGLFLLSSAIRTKYEVKSIHIKYLVFIILFLALDSFFIRR